MRPEADAMGMEEARREGAPLSEAVREEIARVKCRYPTARAALLPALHLAQRHAGGWLPESVIEAVARELDLLPAEVYGVVTFYDLFHQRPVGRHRIRVCTNVPCMLRGSDGILAALRDELAVDEGEVTPEGRCSFVAFECLGSCDTAPMMMVDDEYHENLTPERARQIVRGLA
jgi:NADH-quinone oxidoreductase subunit E